MADLRNKVEPTRIDLSFEKRAAPVPLASLVRTPGDAALVAFHACLATSCVTCNSLLLLALLGSPALLARNNYLYTLSITVTDLVAGGSWFYLGLYDVGQEMENSVSTQRVLSTVHGISLITIMAATVDRYLAVKYPFAYLRRMTRTRVLLIIALAWAWPVSSMLLRVIFPSSGGQTSQGSMTLIIFVAMIGVILILNAGLYVVTRRQQGRGPHADGESKHRSAWLIMFASSLFITLWTPNIIYLSVCFIWKLCMSVQNLAKSPLSVLLILNTLSTPLIFMFGSPLTRAALKALLRRFVCKRSTATVNVQ